MEQYLTEIFDMNAAITVLCFAFTVICFFCLRSNTTKEEDQFRVINTDRRQDHKNEISSCEQLKHLSTRDFWLAAVSSSLTIALNYTFATVIGQLLVPYGNTQVELLGIVVNFFGIVGASILAVVI